MTDRRSIAVGDLVVVVGCCCHTRELGLIRRVLRISDYFCDCDECRDAFHGVIATLEEEHDDYYEWAVRLSWLKRIPPLEELEGERTEENMKEPA